MNYTLLLGRVWFGDDDAVTTTIDIGGMDTTITLEKKRVVVKI